MLRDLLYVKVKSAAQVASSRAACNCTLRDRDAVASSLPAFQQRHEFHERINHGIPVQIASRFVVLTVTSDDDRHLSGACGCHVP